MANTYKRLYYIGFVAYLCLFIFSVLFYKERVIIVDTAFYLFTMVRDSSFITGTRFGAIITEIYPLLAIKAGMSLPAIMMVYSVSFVFYHFIYYVICGLVCKKYEFGLVMLLFNILFTSHTFYWAISELPQGINFLILVLAISSSVKPGKLKPVAISFIFLSLFALVFFHPLMVIPFVYCLAFFLVRKKQVIEKKLLWLMGGFFIVVFAVKTIFFSATYDSQAMANSLSTSSSGSFFGIYANQHFIQNCMDWYYFIPIMSLITIIYYLLTKEWYKNGLFVVSMLGHIFLVNITHPGSEVTDFYMENQYMPLAFFIAIPVVFDVLPGIGMQSVKLRFAPVFLFTAITFLSCVRIFNFHKGYTDRLNWERDFLKKYAGKKMLVDESKVPIGLLLMTWTSPYEFWLLSTSETDKSASVVITGTSGNYVNSAKYTNKFMTIWGDYPYKELPHQYFKFTDTVSSYVIWR